MQLWSLSSLCLGIVRRGHLAARHHFGPTAWHFRCETLRRRDGNALQSLWRDPAESPLRKSLPSLADARDVHTAIAGASGVLRQVKPLRSGVQVLVTSQLIESFKTPRLRYLNNVQPLLNPLQIVVQCLLPGIDIIQASQDRCQG